jgi:hypothetical protein
VVPTIETVFAWNDRQHLLDIGQQAPGPADALQSPGRPTRSLGGLSRAWSVRRSSIVIDDFLATKCTHDFKV